MRHHQLWKSARYVAGGRWQYKCISLLLSRQFALWRWLEKGGSVLVADGTTYNVWIASAPVTLPINMLLEAPPVGGLYVGLALENADPQAIVASILGKKRKRSAFCFAKVEHPREGQLLHLSAGSIQVGNRQVPLVGHRSKKQRRGVVPVVVSEDGCSILPCWSLT